MLYMALIWFMFAFSVCVDFVLMCIVYGYGGVVFG